MTRKPRQVEEKPVLTFAARNAWRAWLGVNHGTSSGVWLRLAKKSSGLERAPTMRLSISRCLRRLAPVVLILAAVAACGPFRRGAGYPPAALIFTNESLDQATVYIVGPGLGFRRIGTVFAGQTDTLTVPADVAVRGTLNIVARLLARSDVPQTGPVSIRPGEQYEVRLPLNSRLISFLPAGS